VGQFDVFWRDGNNIQHLANRAVTSLADTTVTGSPSGLSWGNGHEEVFWEGGDSNLWHDWQR
jgi:hypothetical protein